MAAYDEELSRQYHSLRLYYGIYDEQNVPYRIGDNQTTVLDRTERYYDTWINFHLIPAERPIVQMQKVKTKVVSIPGRKNPIDMSNYLTGHNTFSNCNGTWTFYVDNDFVNNNGGWIAFDKYLRDIIHGHLFKVVLRDDPHYFYFGELTFGQWNTGANFSNVSISYNLYPYKKSYTSTLDMWKFDDFDFTDDIIQYMKDMDISGTRTVQVIGSPERVSPHISGTSGLVVEKYENSTWVNYGNVPTYSIDDPKSIIPRLIIGDGINRLRFRGNGTVTIDYRRGLL